MDLVDELEARVLCGDGAMGTLLLAEGIPLERCFEELCVSDPDRIRTIHEQYIGAGARVIKTNTFGANAVRLERFGMESRVVEINHAAAKIAKEAAGAKDVYVAGSVGPLGISADEADARGIDRAECFREQIRALVEGGVELIFFETFMDFAEIEIAFRAKKELSGLPAICSFSFASEEPISSGALLVDAFAKLRDQGEKIFGVNCMNGPQGMAQLLEHIPAEYLLAAYPNAGYPKYHQGRFIYHAAPEEFAQAARGMAAKGARLIGGCCGTNANHVAAIAAAIGNSQPASGHY
jgi:homocysteine S-methyltransferase